LSNEHLQAAQSTSFTGNNAKNFKEQLQWFLESTEKDDAIKIGIILSHDGREARELFPGLWQVMIRSLIKCWRGSRIFAHHRRTSFMKDMGFGWSKTIR